jgi:hypothetical protein
VNVSLCVLVLVFLIILFIIPDYRVLYKKEVKNKNENNRELECVVKALFVKDFV